MMSHTFTTFKLTILLLLLTVIAACTPTTQVQQQNFTATANDAGSAVVEIGAPFQSVSITALEDDSTELIAAEVEYIGQMTFDVAGENPRTVLLREETNNQTYVGEDVLQWLVALNPNIPMQLSLNIGSGSIDADLATFQLQQLMLSLSSGQASVNLPSGENPITGSIEISSGEVTVFMAEGGVLLLDTVSISSGRVVFEAENAFVVADLDISSGDVVFEVADDAPVRVIVDDVSSGMVDLPAGYVKISGAPTDPEGVWESSSFADAPEGQRSELRIGISSGSVSVR